MTPVRLFFTFLITTILIIPCWSQIESNPWSFPKYKQALSTSKNIPQQHTVVQLKEKVLVDILDRAPLRFSEEAKQNTTFITLPLGDGTLQEFIIEEAPVLHPDLGKKYPDIRSFVGQSISDPTITTRFSYSPKGFQALTITAGQTSIIDTYNSSNKMNHVVYNRKDRVRTNTAFECSIRRHEDRYANTAQSRSQQGGDCQFRTYRLALACTGEYSIYHGGTTADALAAMNASITRINGVFENELAISLQIIPNNTDIIFLNPNTDSYNNSEGFEMLDQNQATLDRIIGSSNYDIGHVFSTWGGGGVAHLAGVCDSRYKAQGVTGSREPEGDFFDIDFVAHEFGHQFGANHTFNGTREACGGINRSLPSAVEPGGGTTIMAYAGICGSQNVQIHSDVYFHAQSIEEISNFITSDGNGCAQITNLNNEEPTANAGQDFIIPRSTPFVLSGSSSDPDGDLLTYTWEQMDTENSTQPPVSTSTGGPLFRSLPPTTSIDRFFPDLEFLSRNIANRWEVLPSVSRDMNFRFTVRDNNIGGGCTGEDDMNLRVNDQAGPFIVLSPNTNVNWLGGNKEIVTWDVANTDTNPINETLVDILLSVDGGLSFTQTILSNTPNTGTAEIVVPNVETEEARIMVRASNNVFFNISNRNFTIEPVRDDFLVFINEANKETCLEMPTIYQVDVNVSGSLDGSVSLSSSGLPNGIAVSFSNNNFVPPSAVNLTLTPDATVLPGTYDFVVNVTGTTGVQSRNLSLTIINSANDLVLDSPSNNDNAVEPTATFAWNVLQGAEEYTLQIATDLDFSNPITYTDVTTNIFSIPASLSTSTRYYWKVIAEGQCLGNKESETFTFLTSNIACKIFDSEDVPIAISRVGSPTITSTINIPDEGIVTDINVLNLQIDHTFVRDLAVGLSSPEEELAILLFFPCFDEQNVDINFDDDVSNSHSDIPCPPADGGRYNSLDDLSVFDGSSVNGAWTLIVNDDADDDGGSLNTWSLEVCFLQESLVIALSINADKTDETCFGNNDGTASVNALDGTGNYSFLWSNGATDASIENLAPGTYTVTVSDGVTDIVESMTIAAAAEIVSSFDLSNQSCSDSADGQITAMAADLDYLWPDGSTGTTFNNLVLGSYEVLITDPATGCSTTEILEISAPDPILIATAIENVSCAGGGDGSIIATISGGIQPYTINTSDLTFLSAGDYMIPVTDANGCIQSTIATVTEPNPITIDFSASGITRVGATDGAINASASGGNEGYIYNWSNSDTGASISGLAEGTYELTVTDQNGCRKTESTVVAGIECSTISIQLAVDQNTTLNGADGRISASVTGQQASFTYLWSTGATTATITDLPVGTYTVTVTDESGCTGVHTAVLNEVECIPFSILLDIDQITELGGSDGRISASVEGQGTYSYLWSTGATTDAISDLTVGTYSVTVTDERGCTTTQTAVLNEVNCTPFSISFDVVPISIFNGSDASIAVSVDGQGTYTYEWSTGAITDTISDLPEGFYSVTITDDMGCIQVQTLELEGFDCTSFNIDFVTSEPNCRVADGMIAASVVGSNGPFAFKWSTGSEGEAITDISSGNYEVTVTDISGCSSVSDIVLTEGNDLTPPTLDCPENRVVTNACNNPVNYDLVANDNCSMVQLELLQGLESGSAFPQGETLVEYMAIDEAGNMATCSFMITNSSDMSLEYDPTFLIPNNDDQILFAFDLKCSDPNEAITNFVSINGGLPPFTFDVFEVSNGGSATIYSVNVTDATGCLIQDQVNFLNINDTEGLISPIVDVVIQDVSTGADGGIAIEVDDRFGIVSFTWTREDTVVSTNQNIENVEAGDYVLELRDEFGCTYTSDYEVQMLTSTNQLLLEETVQIIPNPTTGNFQIQVTLPNPVPVSIELYDVNGRLLQPAIRQNNTDLPINIDISQLAKGIYFTKISAEQEVIVKRVVLL